MIDSNKYIGMTSVNKQGLKMTIVEYFSSTDISVMFDGYDNIKKHCRMTNFKTGRIKNNYYPEIFNVACVGDKYSASKNEINRKIYSTWHGMIERCYSERSLKRKRSSSYNECKVCEEWLCFENFYEWIIKQDNYDKWLAGGFDLDKDIIKKNNKVYKPDSCCLIPHYINKLFTNHRRFRGKYPVGVTINCYGTFTCHCNNFITKENKHFGNFATPEEAFYKYKDFKESIIKQSAQIEYENGNITYECYKGMMNYTIDIED